VHLTIAISESNKGENGVSGTKREGVEEGCFCGVGSSSMRKTVGFGSGCEVLRFLEWTGNGVVGSSSSERMIGSIFSDVKDCGGSVSVFE